MFNVTKKNMTLSLLLVGLPVMLSFQNCSQNGTASVNGTSVSAAATSESLVIVPPSSNPSDITIRPPAGSEDDNISSEKGSIGSCDRIAVSDLLLKIVSISSKIENPNEVSFEIVDPDKSISLEKLHLKIKAKKTERVRELTLILSTQGNKILTTDNTVVEVNTPINEQSVVRVSLKNEYTVSEDSVYDLVLTMNPNELIAATSKDNCLFKPLIETADLVSLAQ